MKRKWIAAYVASLVCIAAMSIYFVHFRNAEFVSWYRSSGASMIDEALLKAALVVAVLGWLFTLVVARAWKRRRSSGS